MPETRVLVLGVGNVLEGDDGVGIAAVGRLAEGCLPEGVRAYDMGTALLDLPSEVSGAGRVVVIDAVQTGGRPGTVYRAELDGLEEEAGGEPLSLHQVGVGQMLAMARLSGLELGPAVLVGVEAEDISLREGLSESVERALPRVLEIVTEEIEAALAPSEEVRA